MRGKQTRLTAFRLSPEVEELLKKLEIETKLTRNDLVNIAIVVLAHSGLSHAIPLLYYATRRRKKYLLSSI